MTTDFWLYLVTWNVGDADPAKDFTQLLGLDTKTLPNLYAIGLQEMKSSTTTLVSDAMFDDPWTTALTDCLAARNYVRVRSIRLIGMHLVVYIRRDDLPYVSNIESTYTRTGLGGYWGSKGTVTIRLDVYGVNVCILNSHFQAHPENFAPRIEDYNMTLECQRFKNKDSQLILDHDYVFWMGDLNFRIDDIENSVVRQKSNNHDFEDLKKHDQLNNAREKQLIFLDFDEGPINFAPTFKFDPGTDNYDTSSKNRVPSWCDRILWHVHEDSYEGVTLGVTQLHYTSLMSYKDSDHKPVVAEFLIKVLKNVPELPVMFEPLSCWCLTKDCPVTYVIPASFPVRSRDWIGIYKNGYRDWRDYVGYVWASVRPVDVMSDGARLFNVMFDSKYLQKLSPSDDSVYYLCYYSSAQDCIVGYSDSLRLLTTEESSDSSNSIMGSSRNNSSNRLDDFDELPTASFQPSPTDHSPYPEHTPSLPLNASSSPSSSSSSASSSLSPIVDTSIAAGEFSTVMDASTTDKFPEDTATSVVEEFQRATSSSTVGEFPGITTSSAMGEFSEPAASSKIEFPCAMTSTTVEEFPGATDTSMAGEFPGGTATSVAGEFPKTTDTSTAEGFPGATAISEAGELERSTFDQISPSSSSPFPSSSSSSFSPEDNSNEL